MKFWQFMFPTASTFFVGMFQLYLGMLLLTQKICLVTSNLYQTPQGNNILESEGPPYS